MSNVIEIKGLAKKYKNGFQFGNIDLSIKEGRIVGVIGETGAGKTTLLKCMLNILSKDSGTVTFFDKNMDDYDSLIKEEVGIVMDDVSLPDILDPKQVDSVMKDLYHNWDSREYFNYLSKFNVPLDKKVLTLSTSLKRKFQIACALAHHPKVLILDEPTNGLDPIAKNDVLKIFKEFTRTKGNTIILASHMTDDLDTIADDIVFLNKGKIILEDELDDIRERFGIVVLDKKSFDKLDRKDYLSYIVENEEYIVLIHDRKNFSKKYKKNKMEDVDLESLMILMLKGVK